MNNAHKKFPMSFIWHMPLILQTIVWIPTYVVLKIFLRLEVRGIENLIGLRRPVIFAPNHSSELDPILVPATIPFLSATMPIFYTSREQKFYEKKGLSSLFYGGGFFKIWGAYSVGIGDKNYEQSLKTHIDIIENRRGSICIFPEGQKTKDGSLLDAKGGVAFLSHRTGAPIVPVAINGIFKMSKEDFFHRRRKAVVSFGRPIASKDLFEDRIYKPEEYKGIAGKVLYGIKEMLDTIVYTSQMSFMKDCISDHRVKVDIDSNQNYEINGITRKLVNVFLVPVLNILPASLRDIVRKSHRSAQKVIDNKTTHKALEVLYNNGELPHMKKKISEKVLHKVWFNTNNSKSVRNRLKIVQRELSKAVANFFEHSGGPLTLLSIASGSARAVAGAVKNTENIHNGGINVTFLDKNTEAISYSKNLIKQCGFSYENSFRWVVDTASNFTKYYKEDEKLHIVEMVGLLDYFDDEKVIDIFKIIYDNLEVGGVLVTANIDNNVERRFVTNLIGWKMFYRNASLMINLATKSGFHPEKITAYYEPLLVHSVLVLRK